jgi:RNA recognition motif-containing protein
VVTGVVIKGTFSFVNTSDKIAAIHAREALSGTVLNGGVLRINFAKESGRLGTSFDQTYGPGGSSQQSHGNGSQQSSYGNGSQQSSYGNGSQQSHGNGSQQRYMRPPY